MRQNRMKPTNRVRTDQAIIDRWVELRDKPPEGWDEGIQDGIPDPKRSWRWASLSLAEQEVISRLDSVYLGEVSMQLRCNCPTCGNPVVVELAGGQVIAQKDGV